MNIITQTPSFMPKPVGRFNLKDEDDFEKVRIEAEAFYQTVGEVYCPYFKEKIAFNSKGLKHLKFKSDQVARVKKDQYARLKLLKYAPAIIQESKTVQGIREVRQFEMQNMNSRWEKVLKDVTFYEFISVVDNLRIKVVIKQVALGQKYFWSVRPFWGIDKVNSKRVLHSISQEDD
jgi:hypothetical protein